MRMDFVIKFDAILATHRLVSGPRHVCAIRRIPPHSRCAGRDPCPVHSPGGTCASILRDWRRRACAVPRRGDMAPVHPQMQAEGRSKYTAPIKHALAPLWCSLGQMRPGDPAWKSNLCRFWSEIGLVRPILGVCCAWGAVHGSVGAVVLPHGHHTADHVVNASQTRVRGLDWASRDEIVVWGRHRWGGGATCTRTGLVRGPRLIHNSLSESCKPPYDGTINAWAENSCGGHGRP